MTPILVLFFGVPPLAAVSSDLVASAVMKPVGGVGAHPARDGGLAAGRLAVRRLGAGAPSAGVLVTRALGAATTCRTRSRSPSAWRYCSPQPA